MWECVSYEFRMNVEKDHNAPENHCPSPWVVIRFSNVERHYINLGDAGDNGDNIQFVAASTFHLRAEQSFSSHQVYCRIAKLLYEIGVPPTTNIQIMRDFQCKMNSKSSSAAAAAVRIVRILVAEITRKFYWCDEVLEKVSWPVMAESGESSDEDDGEEQCVICLEELLYVTQLSRMPCSHLYHSLCIAKWLTVHETCPSCRFPILETDS